jgi:hypothetical protein
MEKYKHRERTPEEDREYGRLKSNRAKGRYSQKYTIKKVNNKYLFLGRFETVEEVDKYFDDLVEFYLDNRKHLVSMGYLYDKVLKDGLVLSRTQFTKIINQTGLQPYKKLGRRRKTRISINFAEDVHLFLSQFVKPSVVVNEAVRWMMGMPTDSLLITLPNDKRVFFRFRTDGSLEAWVLNELTTAELSVVQRLANKCSKFGDVDKIKKEIQSFPGWNVYGGFRVKNRKHLETFNEGTILYPYEEETTEEGLV